MQEWQNALTFDIYGICFIFAYLLALILLAFICRRFNNGDTPEKFFLANRGLGFVVVVFTLYATQYSANTLLGFTGKAYRIGFSWILVIQFFIFVIIFYLLYVPKLYHIAKKNHFITPTDYLKFRFHSPTMVLIAACVMLVAMGNFLIAQLMAMGRIFEGIFGANFHGYDMYLVGAVSLALIIVIYETVGGMLAVAWTDLIQGVILLLGFIILFIMTTQQLGTLPDAIQIIQTQYPSSEHLTVPNPQGIREWISFVVLMGLGAALYPQAIQRVYAAKSKKVLFRSFKFMLFFPFFSALIAIIVGIIGAAFMPGLDGAEADGIVPRVMGMIMQSSTMGYWSMVLLFASILAAMMSTADSLLLSIVSILTIDIYQGFFNQTIEKKKLARLGKKLSWTIMTILVIFAILLRNTTLVALLERKFDILVQLAPAFILGINCPKLNASTVLSGLIVGLVVTLVLTYTISGKIFGIHAGLYGLFANTFIVLSLLIIDKGSGINKAAPSQY